MSYKEILFRESAHIKKSATPGTPKACRVRVSIGLIDYSVQQKKKDPEKATVGTFLTDIK